MISYIKRLFFRFSMEYNFLMSKIRKLYYFDKKNAEEMISFLNNSSNDTYINRIMFNPFLLLHHLIPLRIKYLPESFVLKEGKDIKGLITVAPTKNPLRQVEIQKLLFEEGSYEIAGELIQFVVAKYKAMGAASLIVRVDDYLPDLVKLFVSKCGFSQISYEKLWRIHHVKKVEYNKKLFRLFRNSDSKPISELYNEELLPHFRPLLSKGKREYQDAFCAGLTYYSEYKYVLDGSETNKPAAFISIKTSDNENYVIEILQSSWASIDIDTIIYFANTQIKKRKKRFNLFIKSSRYMQQGEVLEKAFLERKFECVQNQIVLTNSSAKIIKDGERSGKFTVLSQFYTGITAVNSKRRLD